MFSWRQALLWLFLSISTPCLALQVESCSRLTGCRITWTPHRPLANTSVWHCATLAADLKDCSLLRDSGLDGGRLWFTPARQLGSDQGVIRVVGQGWVESVQLHVDEGAAVVSPGEPQLPTSSQVVPNRQLSQNITCEECASESHSCNTAECYQCDYCAYEAKDEKTAAMDDMLMGQPLPSTILFLCVFGGLVLFLAVGVCVTSALEKKRMQRQGSSNPTSSTSSSSVPQMQQKELAEEEPVAPVAEEPSPRYVPELAAQDSSMSVGGEVDEVTGEKKKKKKKKSRPSIELDEAATDDTAAQEPAGEGGPVGAEGAEGEVVKKKKKKKPRASSLDGSLPEGEEVAGELPEEEMPAEGEVVKKKKKKKPRPSAMEEGGEEGEEGATSEPRQSADGEVVKKKKKKKKPVVEGDAPQDSEMVSEQV